MSFLDEFPVTRIDGGGEIIKEGSWAYWAYSIEAGKVNVFKKINGKNVLINTIKKGEVFGEMAFMGGTQRSVSVIAEGDVDIRMIPVSAFMKAFSDLPEDLSAKVKGIISDLTCLSEVSANLKKCSQNLESIKSNSLDMNTLEQETAEVPEILKAVIIALGTRLNSLLEKSNQMVEQLEETVNSVSSI